jgi:hypothetical protein
LGFAFNELRGVTSRYPSTSYLTNPAVKNFDIQTVEIVPSPVEERGISPADTLEPDPMPLEPAANDPSLLQALTGGPEYLRAEVLYGATHEGGLHAEDILRRRLRLDWKTRDHGIASLDEVVSIMGDTLGWTESRRKDESEYYKRVVETELEAQQQPDDAKATKAMSALAEPPWVLEITR